MPLDTFDPPSNPSVNGTRKQMTPRVTVAEFGDGYSQRGADGLNPIKRVFTASWEALSSADVKSIEDFFEAKAGQTAFLWTLPNETIERKFICKTWTPGYLSGDNGSITAELTEVFDL